MTDYRFTAQYKSSGYLCEVTYTTIDCPSLHLLYRDGRESYITPNIVCSAPMGTYKYDFTSNEVASP